MPKYSVGLAPWCYWFVYIPTYLPPIVPLKLLYSVAVDLPSILSSSWLQACASPYPSALASTQTSRKLSSPPRKPPAFYHNHHAKGFPDPWKHMVLSSHALKNQILMTNFVALKGHESACVAMMTRYQTLCILSNIPLASFFPIIWHCILFLINIKHIFAQVAPSSSLHCTKYYLPLCDPKQCYKICIYCKYSYKKCTHL